MGSFAEISNMEYGVETELTGLGLNFNEEKEIKFDSDDELFARKTYLKKKFAKLATGLNYREEENLINKDTDNF